MTLRKRGHEARGPEWIAVCLTHNIHEAHIIVGKLRSYDIPAMLHHEAGAMAIGITLGALGEIKVLVSPADYERAAALLRPEETERLEANTDKIQVIWPHDAEDDTDNDEE